jgi:hypothetical protein
VEIIRKLGIDGDITTCKIQGELVLFVFFKAVVSL